MNENIIKLMSYVNENEELKENLLKATSVEYAYELIKDLPISISFEEFKEYGEMGLEFLKNNNINLDTISNLLKNDDIMNSLGGFLK